MASLLLLLVLCIHQCTANRLLLQTPVTPNIYGFIPSPTMSPTHPPPGEQIGAYGQTCKIHSGRMQCGDPGQSNQISLPPFQRHIDCSVCILYITAITHSKTTSIQRPFDCCLCETIQCGTPWTPICNRFIIGESGIYGNKAIDIYGEPKQGATIECNGVNACKDTMINAQIVSEVICNAHYSCQNMKMTLMYPYPGFTLNCGVTGACQGAEIILSLPSDGSVCDPNLRQEYHLGPIECIGIGACNDMKFTIVNDGCYNIVIDSLECRQNSCTGTEFEFLGNIQYKAGLFDIDITKCLLAATGPQPIGVDRCYWNMKGIECRGKRSCFNQLETVINPADGFEILCEGEEACADSSFHFDISEETMLRMSPVQAMKARCVGYRACKNADILITKDVTNTVDVSVEVVCIERGSCVGATFFGVEGVTFSKIECSERDFCFGCTVNGRPCFSA